MPLSDTTRQQLDTLVKEHDVLVFMKGRRRLPQCGFSAQVVSMLDQLLDDYKTVNVLESMEIRDGVKQYSDWPTIPQLYIKGEFVGGCDIVTQMFESGQLQDMLGVEVKEVAAPTLTLTDGAKAAFEDALKDNPGTHIRFEVDAKFRPNLDLDQPKANDFQVETNGLTVLVSKFCAERVTGATIDFVAGSTGGFKIDNPNEPPKVKAMSPKELKGRLDGGESFELLDVRTQDEWNTAHVDGFTLIDERVVIELRDKDKSTPLVFMCKSGRRSQAAAQEFIGMGFTKVYNVSGGILAWSREVDPSVPTY